MPKRKDLTNQRFGDFVVKEMLYKYKYCKDGKTRTYCRCLGDDDKEYIIRMDALTSGATRRLYGVGMKNIKKDLTGMKFGLLTPLYDTGNRNNTGHVIWHCKCDCGNECDVLSTNLLSKHTMSCGCRNFSKWELFIYDYLVNNDISFIFQKRFSDCKNKKGTDMLPFDFYLNTFNKCIEYDGLHHFQSINYWGGEDKFYIIKENDNIKNKYCETNNIGLLRIPYYYKEEDIINSINLFINPVTTTVV